MILALTALASTLLGLAAGWTVRGRALDALAIERRREQDRIRTRVLPVLERRASTLEVPRGEADDPIERAVALATAIQSAEEKLVLPFSDTLEISKAELRGKGAAGS